MNIKSLLLGSAAALAVVSFSYAASPGGGGCAQPLTASADPWESPSINETLLGPQLAEAWGGTSPRKPYIPAPETALGGDQTVLGPQLALGKDIAPFIEPEGDGGFKKPTPPSYPTGWGKLASVNETLTGKKPIPPSWSPEVASATAYHNGWGETKLTPDETLI